MTPSLLASAAVVGQVPMRTDVDVLHVRVRLAPEGGGQTGEVLGDGRLRAVQRQIMTLPEPVEWLSEFRVGLVRRGAGGRGGAGHG